VIGFILIAVGVETGYRTISRSLSGRGLKGKPNALIAAESEVTNFFRSLKLIRRSVSSVIAIEVESEYRSVAKYLSGWGPKGEHNALIVTKNEVMNFFSLLKLIR
jgi:hypothetical protein